MRAHNHPRAVANWVVNDLLRELKEKKIEDLPFDGQALGRLIALIDNQTISSKIARNVFEHMVQEGGDPAEIVQKQGLKQVTDAAALEPVVAKLLAEHPEEVARYRAGEKKLLGFFVGQAMKATRGKANPNMVNELLRRKLPSP